MTHHAVRRQRKSHFLAAFFLVLALILLIGSSAEATPEAGQKRVDILELQLEAGVEPYKMPAVIFLHDRHTMALNEKGCGACHPENTQHQSGFIFEFKTADTLDYEAGMELHHAECVGCHQQRTDEAKTAGPLVEECRGCHRKTPAVESAREMIRFDKSLHFRHASAKPISYEPGKSDKNCGACHHVYDADAKKLTYQEGEEGTCRYCHQQRWRDDTRPFRNAVHTDCVNCHQKMKSDNIKAGPVECRGCHSAEALAEIEKVRDVPRIDRGQPDVVLISDWLKTASESGEMPTQLTKAVPFDHKRHESKNDTCRGCHHASLDPCGKCHQTKGISEGDFVTLQEAMHEPGAGESCIGCHNFQKTDASCAGCHSLRPAKRFAQNDCESCHAVGTDRLPELPVDDDAKTEIAASVLQARPEQTTIIDDKQIPETVKIDIMAEEFGPAQLPHRKIVHTLAEKVKDSRMAAVFHATDTTLCMGCHHNSPASVTPPKCASCHKISGATAEDGRPGLKGAYHGQCIGCHDQMGIEKPAATDCAACHEKRPQEGYAVKQSVSITDKPRG